MGMNFEDMTLSQAPPMTDEEALLEAQAWGFDTIDEWLSEINQAYQEFTEEEMKRQTMIDEGKMMKEKLKEASLTARVKRHTDKIRTLALILGEVETEEKRTGKSVDDSFINGKIKKIIQANEECLKHRHDPDLISENEYLATWLPTELSELEIVGIIQESGATNVGEAMKFLKENYAGQYDGKLASSVARVLL